MEFPSTLTFSKIAAFPRNFRFVNPFFLVGKAWFFVRNDSLSKYQIWFKSRPQYAEETRCFRSETHQMFPVHTTRELFRRSNLTTQHSLVTFDLCLRKPRAGKSRDYCDVIVFAKLRFQMFSIHTKTKTQRVQIPSVWRAFRKAPFSWRISVDGRPNCRNKAA